MRFKDKIRRCKLVKTIEMRINKMIAIQLAKQRLDDLALNSMREGVGEEPVQGEDLVVSLTTHGKRIHCVHRAIESIFQQSLKPNRVVLYVPQNEFCNTNDLPIALQLQMTRGLDVRFVKDLGPYTKLLYAQQEFPNSTIVTIDDDIMYPAYLIERLVKAHKGNNKAICGLAVRQLEWSGNKRFKPFKDMDFVVLAEDGISNMYIAEGFGGVLYPPHCFSAEVNNEEVFMKLAPKADDLWFWANAIIAETPILCVHSFQPLVRELLVDDDVQDVGLLNDNFFGNGNDKQLKALCEHYHLYEKLR